MRWQVVVQRLTYPDERVPFCELITELTSDTKVSELDVAVGRQQDVGSYNVHKQTERYAPPTSNRVGDVSNRGLAAARASERANL